MEQAYGFTPTHTEQYISPTNHKCKKYKFQAQANSTAKIPTKVTHPLQEMWISFSLEITLIYSIMQIKP